MAYSSKSRIDRTRPSTPGSNTAGNSRTLRRNRAFSPRRNRRSYTRFSGRCSASALCPRSIGGDTATTPASSAGASAPISPAAFSTRLPPMLYPASTTRAHPRATHHSQHRRHIAAHAAVVQRGRQRIRAAAVAHVHAHHVHARAPQLVRIAHNVLRVRRTLKPVHQHDGHRLAPVRLPVAVAQHVARQHAAQRHRARQRLHLLRQRDLLQAPSSAQAACSPAAESSPRRSAGARCATSAAA